MIRQRQFSHCCRTPGLWASSRHWGRGAFPDPIPTKGKLRRCESGIPGPNSFQPSQDLNSSYLQKHGGWCPQSDMLPLLCWLWHKCHLEERRPQSFSVSKIFQFLWKQKLILEKHHSAQFIQSCSYFPLYNFLLLFREYLNGNYRIKFPVLKEWYLGCNTESV